MTKPLDYAVATKLRAPSGRIFRIYSDGEMDTLLRLGWSLVYADTEETRAPTPAPSILPNVRLEQ